MPDPQSWWLTLPPCPRCGLGHVLIDCGKRLPFELGEETRDAT